MLRREFLVGCSSAIAAMAGSRISGFGFSPDGSSVDDIFIYVFLRGGCDGLNLVAPVNDASYVVERPSDLRITDTGDDQGLALGNGWSGFDFRMHHKAPELKELFDSNALAIVHAAGLTNGTRSHFDAQDIIERGSLTDKNLSEGWFTRYLQTTTSIPSGSKFPSMAISASTPATFLGSNSTLALTNPADYRLRADQKFNALLRGFYKNKTLLDDAAINALDSIQFVNQHLQKDDKGGIIPYAPANNTVYPDIPFGRSLKTLAQIIKMEAGLQVATLDYGGWDTHEHQTNVFNNLTEGLSKGLGAFYNDMAAYQNKVTVLVMSEFGRRLKANKSGGTDHGHGNVMLALGGNVIGGKLYGKWPGLANEQLDNNVDLAVTTDYRTVLSEIIMRRLSNPKLGYIFPGIKEYKPLGFMKGEDADVDFGKGKAAKAQNMKGKG